MKLLLLVICCMICSSLAGLIDKQAKLEAVLNDIEELLQDLKADDVPEPVGDLQELESMINERELQAVLNGAVIEGDISPKPSHKQDSQESPAMEEMLLHTENIDKATTEVEAAGGHVLLQLGHNLLVANVPSHVAKQNGFSQASAHISSSASAETLSHANAYWMARENEMKPQPTVQHWTEKTAPMAFKREDSDEGVQGDAPYRQTMTGKIAAVSLVASGPGCLAISGSEYQKIISECQAGLKFWANQAQKNGVRLSFVLYAGKATITASDPTYCSSYASCHDVFANPTLQACGYPTGKAGKDQVVQYVKNHACADGAFLAFFSKYRQRHFAYAYFGGGPIYMQYSNDGWGPNQIDRVFAHEVGHVFNAPDEYTKCNCTQQYGRGSCTAKNSNCNTCTSSQASCIMDVNDLNLCEYTKKHVGWC
ncbi:uncharacterized protein LOC135335792 [Halichondria panicea]|uniref:uncharacterized protein LOC135335792 n=1 Tax=Halichondria panicea TaxID=6063 RepID=UPI00312B63DD